MGTGGHRSLLNDLASLLADAMASNSSNEYKNWAIVARNAMTIQLSSSWPRVREERAYVRMFAGYPSGEGFKFKFERFSVFEYKNPNWKGKIQNFTAMAILWSTLNDEEAREFGFRDEPGFEDRFINFVVGFYPGMYDKAKIYEIAMEFMMGTRLSVPFSRRLDMGMCFDNVQRMQYEIRRHPEMLRIVRTASQPVMSFSEFSSVYDTRPVDLVGQGPGDPVDDLDWLAGEFELPLQPVWILDCPVENLIGLADERTASWLECEPCKDCGSAFWHLDYEYDPHTTLVRTIVESGELVKHQRMEPNFSIAKMGTQPIEGGDALPVEKLSSPSALAVALKGLDKQQRDDVIAVGKTENPEKIRRPKKRVTERLLQEDWKDTMHANGLSRVIGKTRVSEYEETKSLAFVGTRLVDMATLANGTISEKALRCVKAPKMDLPVGRMWAEPLREIFESINDFHFSHVKEFVQECESNGQDPFRVHAKNPKWTRLEVRKERIHAIEQCVCRALESGEIEEDEIEGLLGKLRSLMQTPQMFKSIFRTLDQHIGHDGKRDSHLLRRISLRNFCDYAIRMANYLTDELNYTLRASKADAKVTARIHNNLFGRAVNTASMLTKAEEDPDGYQELLVGVSQTIREKARRKNLMLKSNKRRDNITKCYSAAVKDDSGNTLLRNDAFGDHFEDAELEHECVEVKRVYNPGVRTEIEDEVWYSIVFGKVVRGLKIQTRIQSQELEIVDVCPQEEEPEWICEFDWDDDVLAWWSQPSVDELAHVLQSNATVILPLSAIRPFVEGMIASGQNLARFVGQIDATGCSDRDWLAEPAEVDNSVFEDSYDSEEEEHETIGVQCAQCHVWYYGAECPSCSSPHYVQCNCGNWYLSDDECDECADGDWCSLCAENWCYDCATECCEHHPCGCARLVGQMGPLAAMKSWLGWQEAVEEDDEDDAFSTTTSTVSDDTVATKATIYRAMLDAIQGVIPGFLDRAGLVARWVETHGVKLVGLSLTVAYAFFSQCAMIFAVIVVLRRIVAPIAPQLLIPLVNGDVGEDETWLVFFHGMSMLTAPIFEDMSGYTALLVMFTHVISDGVHWITMGGADGPVGGMLGQYGGTAITVTTFFANLGRVLMPDSMIAHFIGKFCHFTRNAIAAAALPIVPRAFVYVMCGLAVGKSVVDKWFSVVEKVTFEIVGDCWRAIKYGVVATAHGVAAVGNAVLHPMETLEAAERGAGTVIANVIGHAIREFFGRNIGWDGVRTAGEVATLVALLRAIYCRDTVGIIATMTSFAATQALTGCRLYRKVMDFFVNNLPVFDDYTPRMLPGRASGAVYFYETFCNEQAAIYGVPAMVMVSWLPRGWYDGEILFNWLEVRANDYRNGLRGQGFTDDFFAAALGAVCTVLGVNDLNMSRLQCLNQALKAMAFWSGFVKGSIGIVKGIKTLLEQISLYIFDYNVFDPALSGELRYLREWTEKMAKEEPLINVEEATVFVRSYIMVHAILAKRADAVPGALRAIVMAKISACKEKVANARTMIKTEFGRICPLHVLMSGPSKKGKTIACRNLMAMLYRIRFGEILQGHQIMGYPKDPNGFWEGYGENSMFILNDECWTIVDPERRKAMSAWLLSAISNDPFFLAMAFGAKGNTPFDVLGVFSTCNAQAGWSSESAYVEEIQALFNRVHVWMLPDSFADLVTDQYFKLASPYWKAFIKLRESLNKENGTENPNHPKHLKVVFDDTEPDKSVAYFLRNKETQCECWRVKGDVVVVFLSYVMDQLAKKKEEVFMDFTRIERAADSVDADLRAMGLQVAERKVVQPSEEPHWLEWMRMPDLFEKIKIRVSECVAYYYAQFKDWLLKNKLVIFGALTALAGMAMLPMLFGNETSEEIDDVAQAYGRRITTAKHRKDPVKLSGQGKTKPVQGQIGFNEVSVLQADLASRADVRISIFGTDKTYVVSGTFFGPRCVAIIGHSVHLGGVDGRYIEKCMFKSQNSGVNPRRWYKVIAEEYLEKADMLLLAFGEDLPAHRSISHKRFIREDQMPDFVGCDVMFSRVTYPANVPIIASAKARVEEEGLYDYDVQDANEAVCGVARPSVMQLKYRYDNEPNSCGSLVYLPNWSGTSKLVGFHVAGSPARKTGICVRLSFEFMEEIWAFSAKHAVRGNIQPGSMEDNIWGVEVDFDTEPIDLGVKGQINCVACVDTSMAGSFAKNSKIIPTFVEPPPHGPFQEEPYFKSALHLAEGALEKYLEQPEYVPLDKNIREEVIQSLVEVYGGYSLTPLTDQQNYEAQAKNTSVGWPTKKGGPTQKSAYLQMQNGVWVMDKRIEWRYHQIVKRAQLGLRTWTVMQDNGKDELVSRENKVRIYSAGCVEMGLATGKFLKPLFNKMMEKCTSGTSAVGINVHGIDWRELHDHLLADHGLERASEHDKVFYCTDLQKADSMIGPAIWGMTLDLMDRLLWSYKKEDRLAVQVLLQELENTTHLWGRRLFTTYGPYPSGATPTAEMMSFHVCCAFRYCIAKVFYMTGGRPGGWKTGLVDIFYGDDNIQRNEQIAWHLVTIEMRQTFGITLTSEKKTADIFLQSISELGFLSRTFSHRGRNAPLSLKTIVNIWYWTRDDDPRTYQQQLDSGLMELTHHGVQVYNHYSSILRGLAYIQVKNFHIMTYDQAMLSRLKSLYGAGAHPVSIEVDSRISGQGPSGSDHAWPSQNDQESVSAESEGSKAGIEPGVDGVVDSVAVVNGNVTTKDLSDQHRVNAVAGGLSLKTPLQEYRYPGTADLRFLLDTVTITAATSVDQVLGVYNFPAIFQSNPQLQKCRDGHIAFKCDGVRVTLNLTGSNTDSMSVLLTAHGIGGQPTLNAIEYCSNCLMMSVCPCLLTVLNDSSASELTVPFSDPTGIGQLPFNTATTFGTICMRMCTPLRSSLDPENCSATAKLYYEIINPVFLGLTDVSALSRVRNQVMELEDAFVGQGPKAERFVGQMGLRDMADAGAAARDKALAEGAAKATSAITNVTFTPPPASAGSGGFLGFMRKAANTVMETAGTIFHTVGAVAAIGGMLGFGRPTNPTPATRVMNNAPVYAHIDDAANSLSMTLKKGSMVPPNNATGYSSQMSMAAIFGNPTMCNRFPFAADASPLTMPITPWVEQYNQYTGAAYFAPGVRPIGPELNADIPQFWEDPCASLVRQHEYFQGSIIWDIYVICSPLLHAKLRLRYFPNKQYPYNYSGDYAEDVLTQLVEIQGTTKVTVRLPFYTPGEIWQPSSLYGSCAFGNTQPLTNWYVDGIPRNIIVWDWAEKPSGGVQAQPVDIVIFRRFGADFKLGGLRIHNLATDEATANDMITEFGLVEALRGQLNPKICSDADWFHPSMCEFGEHNTTLRGEPCVDTLKELLIKPTFGGFVTPNDDSGWNGFARVWLEPLGNWKQSLIVQGMDFTDSASNPTPPNFTFTGVICPIRMVQRYFQLYTGGWRIGIFHSPPETFHEDYSGYEAKTVSDGRIWCYPLQAMSGRATQTQLMFPGVQADFTFNWREPVLYKRFTLSNSLTSPTSFSFPPLFWQHYNAEGTRALIYSGDDMLHFYSLVCPPPVYAMWYWTTSSASKKPVKDGSRAGGKKPAKS